MQLFSLSYDPIISAQFLCERHIGSACLNEASILLCNCFTDEELKKAPKNAKGNFRKRSFLHNPVSKWVISSRENAKWTAQHALAIIAERKFRGYNPHSAEKFVDWAARIILSNKKLANVPDGKITDFYAAIPKEANCRKIKGFDDLTIVNKYRQYYIHDKPFAKWTRTRKMPVWFNSQKGK